MTTEATQPPQSPRLPEIDAVEVYRASERLEAGQQLNKELLTRLEPRLDRQEQRSDRQDQNTNQQFAEVNRRIDRLRYTIVGIGAAIIVGYVLQEVFGG